MIACTEPASALALDAHDLERNTVSRDVEADVPEALTVKVCPGLTVIGTLSFTVFGVAASAAAHTPPLAARATTEERNRDFVISNTQPTLSSEVALEVHLAGVERDVTGVRGDDEPPVSVDSRASARAASPSHRAVEQRVSPADGVQHLRLGSPQPALELAEQLRLRGPDRFLGQAQRAGLVAQLGREVLGPERHVETDAEHRPALLRATFDQDPGHLSPVDLDVVGPLYERAVTRHLGGGHARGQWQQPRRIAQQQRAQQRPSGGRGPHTALAPASGRL